MTKQSRSVRAAIDILNRVATLPSAPRHHAVLRIQRAKRPSREARRIIDHWRKNAASVPAEQLDLSDAQEIRVRLIRNHGGLWEPHRTMLATIEKRIVAGDIDSEEFREAAGRLVTLEPALPKGFADTERRIGGMWPS